MALIQLGGKLRSIRERRGQTLRAVAAAAGVSESLVSQIEHDRVSPAIDTLFALCRALGTDMGLLFADLSVSRRIQVVHPAERRTTSSPGVTYEQLASTEGMPQGHEIEAWQIRLEPGCATGSDELGHPGLELGIITGGKARLTVGSETVPLKTGDAVSFASGSPHRLLNCGTGPLTAYWITTPPGSQPRRNIAVPASDREKTAPRSKGGKHG